VIFRFRWSVSVRAEVLRASPLVFGEQLFGVFAPLDAFQRFDGGDSGNIIRDYLGIIRADSVILALFRSGFGF
jgi:hypothetical protein